MIRNLSQGHHWQYVLLHFATDVLIWVTAYALGVQLRFGDEVVTKVLTFEDYYPSVIMGGLVFATACYVFGLYSPQIYKRNFSTRSFVVLICMGIAVIAMTSLFYLNFSSRVGRGVMAYSILVAFFSLVAHHGYILKQLDNYRERVALVVTCAFDERETGLFDTYWGQHLELAGIIHTDNYQPRSVARILGAASHLEDLVKTHRIDRVLATDHGLTNPRLYQQFCQLRYAGVSVAPLISLFEDVYQVVPLELMTPEWLLNASSSANLLYIKKLKRGFDIVVSLAGIIFLVPFMLLGMLLTKLTSPGPLLYRQVRVGKFGRKFEVIKLRTMRLDAERNGATWAAQDDDRVTPVGGFLRKYRIDEVPQLFNVLRGNMSFVGPRPERPEFIDDLAEQIPHYRERLMVQPGITGWAQVNYPYGATVEDAKRKLEYDLYYLKHMGVLLDLFILADTIRIILKGGLSEGAKGHLPHYGEVVKKAAGEVRPAVVEPQATVR